jgi:hypothetical protein
MKRYTDNEVDEDIMNKNENIHIKLEISKDPMTGDLNIMTRFDPNAPNFIKDENGFSWLPTQEEREFLNEAFDVVIRKK